MEREAVCSTSIRSIGFDDASSTLEVEFNNGVVWQYYDFPESKWYEFKAADSIGKYFYREIKNTFRGSQVG